ncbi:MAG: glycosyltransferase family 4 protein [Bacteroidota bacterium]
MARTPEAAHAARGGALDVLVVEPVGGHGGMDLYDAGLCGGLRDAGLNVALATSQWDRDVEGYEVWTTFEGVFGDQAALWRAGRWVRALLRSLRRARQRGARVCHLHFFQATLLQWVTLSLTRRMGFQTVVTAHDVETFSGDRERWAPRIYALADRVIAHNAVAQDEVVRVLQVSAERVRVVPHGHYLDALPSELPTQVQARHRLGISLEAPTVLFFGQIKPVKGLDVLLQAWPEVRRQIPNAQLVVAGRPWRDDPSTYTALIDALGIGDSVLFRPGYIPNDEVPAYYAACDVVALPYHRIYQSGVLLMAMSYQRAVVASDLPAMREVLRDGEHGRLAPAGDASALAAVLCDLLGDSARTQAMGTAGHAHVATHHDWRAVGVQTARIYQEVAGTPVSQSVTEYAPS